MEKYNNKRSKKILIARRSHEELEQFVSKLPSQRSYGKGRGNNVV